MDNKIFNSINKKCLIDYGFEYFNKKFYMDLTNVVIRIQYRPYPYSKGKMITYDIIIKKLSKISLTSLPEFEEAFEDLTEIPTQMPALKNIDIKIAEGKIINVFDPMELSKDTWQYVFTQKIHELFDPFKEDDLERMRYLVFNANSNEQIIVNDQVRNFLLNNSIKDRG